MALTNTTLASAQAASDTVAVLAASTGVVANGLLLIDGEIQKIVSSYTTAGNGVNVPVIRAQVGTFASAHPSGALVATGAASDSEWGNNAPQTVVQYPIATPARLKASYSASGAITLPTAGNDLVVFLNGTSVLAMTVAAPTSSLNGSVLWIASDGVAQHTVQFTGGLSGAGGSYDVLTINATAPVLLGPFMAVNALWMAAAGVPISGTTTAIAAVIS